MQIFNILSLFPELLLNKDGDGAPPKGDAGEAMALRGPVPAEPGPDAAMPLKVGTRFQATVLGREQGGVLLEAAGRRLVARGGKENLEPGTRVVIEVVKEGRPAEARLVSSVLPEDGAAAKAAKEILMMRANAAWLLPRIKGGGEPLERMLAGLAKAVPEKGSVLELAASLSLQARPDPKAVESLFNIFSPSLLPSVKDELPQALRQAVSLLQQQGQVLQGEAAASGGAGAAGSPASAVVLSQAQEAAMLLRPSSISGDGPGPSLHSATGDGNAVYVSSQPSSQEAAGGARPPASLQAQAQVSSQESHAISPAAASKNTSVETTSSSGPLGSSQVLDADSGLPLHAAGGGERGPLPKEGGVRTVPLHMEPGAKVSEGAVPRGGKTGPAPGVAKAAEVSQAGTGAAARSETPQVQEPSVHPSGGRPAHLLHDRGDAGSKGQPVQQADGWRPDTVEPRVSSSLHLQVLDGLARHITSPSFIHQALSMLGDLPLLIIPFWFGDGSILGHMAAWKEEGEGEKGGGGDHHIFFDLEMDRLGHVSIDVLQRERSIGVTVYAAESALSSVEAALPALGSEIEAAGYDLLWLRALPARDEGRRADLSTAVFGGEESHLIDIEA